MKTVRDGWHRIKGYDVYVENGRVVRGELGHGMHVVTAFPYKYDKALKAFVIGTPLVSTFKNDNWVLR